MVEDGALAVKAFEDALAMGEPFNLILLDIEMPHMDGQQALHQIRQMEKCFYKNFLNNKSVYSIIFMQTSMEDPEQLARAYKKGRCDGFISKPVDRDNLLARMRRHHLL